MNEQTLLEQWTEKNRDTRPNYERALVEALDLLLLAKSRNWSDEQYEPIIREATELLREVRAIRKKS